MQFKNVFHIILFSLLVFTSGFAQQKAEVQFSVHLGDFQSIEVNSSQRQLGVELNSKKDVLEGKSIQQQDHIKVTSTSQYEISVSSISQLVGTQDELPADIIQVMPSGNSTGSPSSQINFSNVALSTQQKTIIDSSSGDIDRSFHMEYFVQGGEELLQKAAGNYKTTISYSKCVSTSFARFNPKRSSYCFCICSSVMELICVIPFNALTYNYITGSRRCSSISTDFIFVRILKSLTRGYVCAL